MKVRQSIVAAIVSSIAVTSIAGQGGFRTLTIEEAVNEAVQRNLGLLAARADLSVDRIRCCREVPTASIGSGQGSAS